MSGLFFGVERTVAEKALEACPGVIILLREWGDKSEEGGWKAAAGRQKSRAKGETRRPVWRFQKGYDAEQGPAAKLLIEELAAWEEDALKTWAADGRLAEGGRLRVPDSPAAPWTDVSVRAAFPNLSDADLIAALIAADGEIDEEAWTMGKYRNIRTLIQGMIAAELDKTLPEKMGALLEPVVEVVRGPKELVRRDLETNVKKTE